ncbi:hypothetical protein SYNPS1DRAFT_28671 [Syncephalis pseudoplumigaleata]|uniref:F-box domain-containing protein n=1 Tax=Syncephalis pseudoplumigaleata TaxID=1712513 RepID=A0A4V1J1M7_9FUNG|nr:hypothetical protein SYNPS1DRAFT_28671 [Syncephalis pseudoplumigaleata]|eukprot:RKP25599.1 hypothetical protein SYNPS1DRAFT_28671 [Syncephalis pseudoplumigaleata]
MTGWHVLPMQVRQCILLFCDGYTVANLAYTCRDLYRTLLADQWLWASLYEVTFPQTEEERHWREWCLAGGMAANGYASRIGPSPNPDDTDLIAQEEQSKLPLSRQPSKSHIHTAVTSPWRTLLVVGDDWTLWMIEHGVGRKACYQLNWTPGCWPGPREFLQNADYIVAVNSFAGHQHSTWVWRANNRTPITDRWGVLSNPHCCPVALYGRWLLVADTERYLPVDPVTGEAVANSEADHDYSYFSEHRGHHHHGSGGHANRGMADSSELDTPIPSPAPEVSDSSAFVKSRKFHVVDLMTPGRVYSMTVAGGFATCHFQSVGSAGVRVYCAQCDSSEDMGEQRGSLYTWSLWGWRAARNDPNVMEPILLNEGRLSMNRDLFNGELFSHRLDASRVLLEMRPFWTSESIYGVHSLWETDILYQGSAGAGRSFPLGRQQLRYLPNDRILAGRLTIDPIHGDIQIGDVLINTAPHSHRSLHPPQREKETRGLNIQLRRTLGALFYATPVTRSIGSSSASSSSSHLHASSGSGNGGAPGGTLSNPFLPPATATASATSPLGRSKDDAIYTRKRNHSTGTYLHDDSVLHAPPRLSVSPSHLPLSSSPTSSSILAGQHSHTGVSSGNGQSTRFTDIHYIIDAHRGKLVGMLHLPTGATPIVSVCATHIGLLDMRNRSLTLLDFSMPTAHLSSGQPHSSHSNNHNVIGWMEEMAGSFKWTRPHSSSLASLADAWRQRTIHHPFPPRLQHWAQQAMEQESRNM